MVNQMKNTEKNIQKITDEISRVKEEIGRELAGEPVLMRVKRVEEILDIESSTRKRLVNSGDLTALKTGGSMSSAMRITKESVIAAISKWKIDAITSREDLAAYTGEVQAPASGQATPTKTKARKPSRTPRPKYLRQKAKPLILEALEDGGIHSWSEVLAYVKSAIRVAKITVELARAELKKDGLIALVKHDRKGREKYKVSHGWYIPETKPLEIHLPETKEQAPGSTVTIETTDEGVSVSSGENKIAFDEDKGQWTVTTPTKRKEKPTAQVKAKDSFLTTATADMLHSVTAPPSGVHTTASGSVPVWAKYQDGTDATATQDEMTQQYENVNFTKRINILREELKSKQNYINKYIEKNWFQKLIYRKGPKPEPLSFDMTISTESDRDASLRGTEEVLMGTWGHEPKKDNKAVGYARGVWTALKGENNGRQ